MRSRAAGVLRTLLGYAAFATPWPRFYFRDKCVITAFHRVNDATNGDGISCTPERFRHVCAWLGRHFDVVPLHEQVEALQRGHMPARTASITFDDGYLDNFEIAAPILRELRMPATFFVATDLIGTQNVPAWDADRGVETRWMNWEQLRRLADEGFSIESHTCSHLDMGRAPIAEVRRQLLSSMQILADRLGPSRRMFAYPFGGQQNITEAARAEVREAGYLSCLSCFGGINATGADPFRLVRMPFNEYYGSVHQFGLEMLRAPVSPAA